MSGKTKPGGRPESRIQEKTIEKKCRKETGEKEKVGENDVINCKIVQLGCCYD